MGVRLAWWGRVTRGPLLHLLHGALNCYLMIRGAATTTESEGGLGLLTRG